MIAHGRRNRIHDFEPWMYLINAAWLLGWGTAFLGQSDLLGLLMVALSLAFAVLGVWGIRWRWKSDIEWNLVHADAWFDSYTTGLDNASDQSTNQETR